MAKQVILTKGLPASGKSTWAKKQLQKKPGQFKRINKDDLRAMLDDSRWSGENEQFVVKTRDYLIRSALQFGKHVIVDDTNLHPRHETRIRELVKEHNASHDDNVQVKIQSFLDVSVETCIKRDLQRMDSVGEKVIRDMYEKYIKVRKDPIQQDESLPKAIICDLDGTLALIKNRSPYDASSCENDEVNTPVAKIVKQFQETHAVLMFSGRSDEYRVETARWLREHDLDMYRELVMREEGDTRKDSIVKREMFEEHVKNKYYVEFVLDDRNQVVDMWRDLGLTCLQVAPGDF